MQSGNAASNQIKFKFVANPQQKCCRRKLGHFTRPHTQAPLNPQTNRPPSPEHSPKIRRKEKLKSHEAINSGSRFHLFLLFTFYVDLN